MIITSVMGHEKKEITDVATMDTEQYACTCRSINIASYPNMSMFIVYVCCKIT